MRRIPRPLGALLGAVAIVGVAWAVLLPPFQAPDENSHFAYTQTIGEHFDLPGDEQRPAFSAEQDLVNEASNADQVAAALSTKPEWSEQAFDRWKRENAALPDGARGDGGGPNPARTNPPLYYLYETVPYEVSKNGTLFDRLYLMRLASVALLLVTVAATWLLAGATAGLQPMVTFVSASVNPDALLIAFWSVAFWLGARILKRGLALPEAFALFAVVALSVATKATGYGLLPAALFVLALGVLRLRRTGAPHTARIVLISLAAFTIPAGGWFVAGHALDRPAVNEIASSREHPVPSVSSFNKREFVSYVWQFYLPKLGFQDSFDGLDENAAYSVRVKTGWGAFGWLEIRFPRWVYALLGLFSAAVLAGAAAAVIKRRRSIDFDLLGFFAIAAATLLAGLDWTEFRTLVSEQGPFNQGRYILPLISLFGVATAAALTVLPARIMAAATGAVVGGFFVLQVFSLAIVAGRSYA